VLLAKAPLDSAYRARVNSLCRVIDVFDFEIDTVGRLVAGHLVATLCSPGCQLSHRCVNRSGPS
jgi:hypothetical protein